jgi:hypothetical protein
MGPLPNTKHEQFCQLLAAGDSKTKAWIVEDNYSNGQNDQRAGTCKWFATGVRRCSRPSGIPKRLILLANLVRSIRPRGWIALLREKDAPNGVPLSL